MSRLHTFFVEDKFLSEGKEITLTDEKVIHQLLRVFRLGVDNEINLINDTGFVFRSVILSIAKKEARIRVTQISSGKDSATILVSLMPSFIKKDKLEWVVEKGTELGVVSFLPILSKHSEKKSLNQERLKTIAREATEQCGRSCVPKIIEPQSLTDALSSVVNPLIVFDGTGERFNAKEMQEKFKVKELGVLIGPEGGWSEEEINLFKEKKIPIYSLGERTLRAETAAVAISSLLLL